jgi:S-DNA-T family DNA segregation ATPase FtsK/SpoIIIE
MVERIKRVRQEIIGVLSVMGSLYLLMSFFTHSVRDPVLFFRTTEPLEPVRNLGGVIGAHLSGWMFIFFGIAVYAIPLFLIAFGIKRLLGREGHKIYLLGGALFLLSSAVLAALIGNTFHFTFEQYPDGIGGLMGRGIASIAHELLSVPGAYLFTLALFLSSLILISPVSVTGIALQRREKGMKKNEYAREEVLPDYEDQEILIKEPELQEEPPLSDVHPVPAQELSITRQQGDMHCRRWNCSARLIPQLSGRQKKIS